MPDSRKAILTSSTNTRSLMRSTIFLPTQAPSRVGGDGLLAAIEQVLAHGPVRVLTVDCANLSYCDSHGLSMLLAAHRRATSAGARLRLVHRPAFLDRLLHRTNTHVHLTSTRAARMDQAD